MQRKSRMPTWLLITLIVLAVLVAASIAYVVLNPSQSGNRAKLERTFSAAEQQRIETVTVSPSELADATCGSGKRCWIAVNGVVYDMGDLGGWVSGLHHGVHAGTDATEKFVKSGHGVAYLQRLPVVGKLGA